MDVIMQVADLTAAVIAGGTAAAIVGGGAVQVLRALRAVVRMADDFNGRPESAPGAGDHRPGVCQRLGAIEVAVGRIPELERRVSALESVVR